MGSFDDRVRPIPLPVCQRTRGRHFQDRFLPRKGKISLYLWPGLDLVAPMLAKLGRHSRGKGCLYVRRLADIDIAVLGEMIATCLSADPQSLVDEAQGGV